MGTNHLGRESKRVLFEVPVEIHWSDAEGRHQSIQGTNHDVAINGLGLVVPLEVPSQQELSVTLNGVAICGKAELIHSQRCSSGFRVGLYFQLTLLMQNVPGLDELLEPTLLGNSAARQSRLTALAMRFGKRLSRTHAPDPVCDPPASCSGSW